jgi:cyclopropane-fatty-acyl-phospholipid synthase
MIPDDAGPVADELVNLATDILGTKVPVRIRAWDGSVAGPVDGPTLVVASPAALRRLLWHPNELGISQAYVTGELDVDGDVGDLLRAVWAAHATKGAVARPSMATVARVAPRALAAMARAGALRLPPAPPASQARLRGRLHTPRRDRAVIAHHYDLSNAFYQLMLDPQLAYSCAYWSGGPEQTLEQAQTAKLELVCHKLGLQAGDRLLDIGCGWGALSIHAARHHGAIVTGVTISIEQAVFARKRADDLGVGDRVEIRLQDYRELAGEPYDAVSSLEMGEHVGDANYPTYGATLARMVKRGGPVLVQQMSRRVGPPGGGPFIEAFIAPDMSMRGVGATVELLEDAGLEVRGVEAMREHYTRTIEAWHDTLESHWDEAVALVGVEVARVWRLYLVGSALAFEQGRMGVDQILAMRPEDTR